MAIRSLLLFFVVLLFPLTALAQWTSLMDAIEPRVEGHSAVIDGKIYVFGGFQTENIVPTDQNEVYNPATNAWSTFESLPVPITHVGSAEVDGEVWLVGGFALIGFVQTVDHVYIYNVEDDEWRTGPSLPEARSAGTLIRLGRKLHYISGLKNRDDDVGTHYVIDLDEPGGPQTWNERAPMPQPRNHLSSATVGGMIYTIGGQERHDTSPEDTDYVHRYDPATDTWTEVASLPQIRSHFEPGTFAVDGKIVIVGGRTGTSNCIDHITVYDPSDDAWTELMTMPDCLLANSAKVIDDELFVSHGGKVNVKFPVTTARKHPYSRSPSDTLGFWPDALSETLDLGEAGKLESVLWTYTGEANYTIDLSNAPAWIDSVTPSTGSADPNGAGLDFNLDTAGLFPGTFSHTFTATAPGYDDAQLTINLTIVGDAAPNVTVTPSVIDFGTLPLGLTHSQTITLTNIGNATATFSFPCIGVVDLESGVEILHTGGLQSDILPGESNEVTIHATPITPGLGGMTMSCPYEGNGESGNINYSVTGIGAGTLLERINSGGPSLEIALLPDWSADTHHLLGKTFENPEVVSIGATSTPELYFTERSSVSALGSFFYAIPLPKPDTYITRLHFAEIYFGAPGGTVNFIDKRIFDVNIEGGMVEMDDYDIAADVGPITAVTHSFVNHISDGEMNIEFTASKDQPKVSGLEVFAIDRGMHQYLHAGWNLVGLPSTPPTPGYETIFDDVILSLPPFAFGEAGYEEATDLEIGTGYWVKTDEAGLEAHPDGTAAESITYALGTGWHMIAGPSCDFPLASATGDTGIIEANSLFGYSQDAGYEESTTLMQGYGYWINTNAPGSITMDCASAGKHGSASNNGIGIASTMHALIFRDALGREQTLYVDETAEPAMMLPPRAPKGQIDVRFAHDSRLLTTNEGAIHVQGLMAPIAIELVTTEDITMMLEPDASGNPIVLQPGLPVELTGFVEGTLHLRSTVLSEAPSPDAFVLQGVYPNPFTTSASILFHAPEDIIAHVDVYDMLGRRVLAVPAASVDAGMNRTIQINRQNLAAGVYIYRLMLDTPSGVESAVGRLVIAH